MLPDQHQHVRRAPRRSGGTFASTMLVAGLAVTGLAACSSDDEGTSPATSGTVDNSPDTTAAPATSAVSTTTETPGTTAAPSTTSEPIDDTAAIEATRAIFADVTDDVPGCTVAVGRDGEVVYAEAFGAARLEPYEPMTTETIVDIGSTSKQFTATAILLLAQDGSLSLDDVVADHVPGLPEWSSQVTVRQMMHHTSGIPDYVNLLASSGFELTGSSTDADALAALADATELDFEPGTAWAYSNSNYFLMGQVVLSVTGMPLDEYLDAEVFQPLGLAMVMDPVAAFPGKAISYQGTGDARTVADSRWEQLGDGGIQTTPSELVRWSSQYWRPTVGGEELLAARFDGAVSLDDPSDPTARYGAGIITGELDGIGETWSHSGGWGGFVTWFTMVPDQQLTIAGTCTSPDTLALLTISDVDDLIEPWAAVTA